METKRYSAKITPDAAATLRRKANDDVCPQELVFSQCAKDVQDRLDTILQDGRIDLFEAKLFPDKKIAKMDLVDDMAGRSNAIKTLNAAEFILVNMLDMTITIRNEMRDDETSYFNFVSLENL